MDNTGKFRALACRTISKYLPRSAIFRSRTTNSQGVDHGFEAQVDLTGANDLSDIRGIIGLEERNFDSFVLEIALRLGEVERSVVWRRMPCKESLSIDLKTERYKRGHLLQLVYFAFKTYQLVRNVILSVDIFTRC